MGAHTRKRFVCSAALLPRNVGQVRRVYPRSYLRSLEKPQSTRISGRMFAAYRPCLPTRAKQAPTGEGWLHEIKHDGFRIIAVLSDGRVRLFTKLRIPTIPISRSSDRDQCGAVA